MSSSPSQNPEEPHGLLYILLAVSSFLVGRFSSQSSSGHRPQSGQQCDCGIHHAQPTYRETAYPPPEMTVVLKHHAPDSSRRYERANNKRNYAVQRCIAVATWFTFGAAAFYGGTTILMWREMQTQTQAARYQFEYTTRPWIKITVVELRNGGGAIKTLQFHWPFTDKEVPPILQVHLAYTNTGHSIASSIETAAEVFYGKFVGDKWHDMVTREEATFCKSALDRKPSGAGVILFPNDPASDEFMGIGGLIHPKDVSFDAKGVRVISAALITCTNYIGSKGSRYQTQSWSGLYDNRSVFIPVGVDIDSSEGLTLIRDPNGDRTDESGQ